MGLGRYEGYGHDPYTFWHHRMSAFGAEPTAVADGNKKGIAEWSKNGG